MHLHLYQVKTILSSFGSRATFDLSHVTVFELDYGERGSGRLLMVIERSMQCKKTDLPRELLLYRLVITSRFSDIRAYFGYEDFASGVRQDNKVR
jgi:hypothetical protein